MHLADQDRSEVNMPHPYSDRFESHIVPHKSFSNKPSRPPPANFPASLDPAPSPPRRIFPRLNRRWQLLPAAVIQRCRDFHSQSFMRAFLIVSSQPLIAFALLFGFASRRMLRHFSLIDSMKLFVRSILTRPAWRNKFHFYTQLHPPRAQTR